MEDSESASVDRKNVRFEENGTMELRCQAKNTKEVANDRESSTESSTGIKSEFPNPPENDLIDIDEIELSDEDTWLYKSPKKLTTEEKGLSPYKWLRKDVEDLDNLELQMAKTALVSKLDELDILTSVQNAREFNCKEEKGAPKTKTGENCDKSSAPVILTGKNVILPECFSNTNGNTHLHHESDSTDSSSTMHEDVGCEKKQLSESRPLNDVTDVLKIARLQEESLKQSSSKFLNESARTFPRSHRYIPPECVRNQKLLKPASVEALHVYNGKQSSPVLMYPGIVRGLMTSSPNQSPFGSTASLNYTHDVHRSSLPNLNKGYCTLRPKKSKRPSEPRIQCPLPMYAAYPKSQINGTTKETVRMSSAKGIIQSPPSDYRESQTLPSSYRLKSRKVPTSYKEVPSPLCRRESAPPPPCQKDNLPLDVLRRDSAPCVAKFKEGGHYPQQQSNTPQRIASPLSPKKNGVMLNQIQRYGGSTPTLQNSSRTLSLNHLPPELKSLPNNEYPQQSAHSPSRRQPLSSVHNWSPKQDDNPVMHNGDTKKSSLPSKIPSPASRSGIPVPSSQYITRTSPVDDTWSQDFY